VHDLTTLYCILHSDDIAQIKVSTQGQKKIKNRFFFFKRFRNGKKDAGKKRILVRYAIAAMGPLLGKYRAMPM
jgi:hypothetical protein